MRTTTALLTALGVLAVLTACKAKPARISDELKNDLTLASSDMGLDLANAANDLKVVSAIEQTKRTPPAVAESRRAPPPKPTREPEPVPADEPAPTLVDLSRVAAPAPQAEPVATVEPAMEGLPAPRPSPVPAATTSGTSTSGSSGGGVNIGDILGTVIGGVIIRGGAVDGDHCDPRTDRRRGRGTSISIGRVMPPVIGRRPPIFR